MIEEGGNGRHSFKIYLSFHNLAISSNKNVSKSAGFETPLGNWISDD